MTEQTWTREPWYCDTLDWCGDPHPHHYYIHGDLHESVDYDDEGNEIDGEDERWCATSVAIVVGNETAGDITKLTAERICACVNFCAGVPSDQMDFKGGLSSILASMEANVYDLASKVAEIDRLRAALDVVVERHLIPVKDGDEWKCGSAVRGLMIVAYAVGADPVEALLNANGGVK